MKPAVFLFALAACQQPRAPQTQPVPTERVTEYSNGHWFDGESFVERTVFVAGDRFVPPRPARIDAVVDLQGGYVVPPFAEGHNHWLEPALVDAYVDTHLREGIFYVRDLSTAPALRDAMRPSLKELEYVSANQGFTGPGGHPIELVDMMIGFGVVPKEWGSTHGEGELLFVVASEADIERVWPRFLDGKPDLVKFFLIHCDEYAQRRDDAKLTPKQRGMDPALAPVLVARARAARLPVVAHIESAHDFHVAVAAGVDHIAHMPFVDAAQPEAYCISYEDAHEAGERGITVATTFEWLGEAEPDDVSIAVTRDNLATLRRAGVAVVVGTDLLRTTARAEAERIVALGLMSNGELLRAWCEATPRAIFPRRKIGRLEDGFEASFLVLGGDPVADFKHIRDIRLRVKLGREVKPGPAVIPEM